MESVQDPRNVPMAPSSIGVLIGILAGAAFPLLPFSRPGRVATLPQESYTSDSRLLAKRALVDFRPDGDLRKAAWKHADSVTFDLDASGKSGWNVHPLSGHPPGF